MYSKNRGSILVTTLIIFSIIITISMTCLGLYYSNYSTFILEYKEANMKEDGYGAIEIVNSNIVQEVNYAVMNTQDKEEFNNYLLRDNFMNTIKDISQSDLNHVNIHIPDKINIDSVSQDLQFKIISTIKDGVYTKKYQARVKIKNPFSNQVYQINTDLEEEIQNEEIKNKEASQWNIKTNINEIVIIYDYKEI